MRFEPLLLAALVLSACDEKPAGPAPARFAAVKKSSQSAGASFCDKQFQEPRRFVEPALRPFGAEAPRGKGWTWVNVWATWCKPCVEEMGMLNRWRDALTADGVDVRFELFSVDDESAKGELEAWSRKNLPGAIKWIRSESDFNALLDTLELDRNVSIPIHLLVDPKGLVRCVRVGAIHEQNYGAVRDLMTTR